MLHTRPSTPLPMGCANVQAQPASIPRSDTLWLSTLPNESNVGGLRRPFNLCDWPSEVLVVAEPCANGSSGAIAARGRCHVALRTCVLRAG